MTISFSYIHHTPPITQISLSAAFRIVIPATKQSNKKLDFSMGRVYVQCDKPEDTTKVDCNKIHFESTNKAELNTYKAFLSAAVWSSTNMTVAHGWF